MTYASAMLRLAASSSTQMHIATVHRAACDKPEAANAEPHRVLVKDLHRGINCYTFAIPGAHHH